jgi:hypothetical protein
MNWTTPPKMNAKRDDPTAAQQPATQQQRRRDPKRKNNVQVVLLAKTTTTTTATTTRMHQKNCLYWNNFKGNILCIGRYTRDLSHNPIKYRIGTRPKLWVSLPANHLRKWRLRWYDRLETLGYTNHYIICTDQISRITKFRTELCVTTEWRQAICLPWPLLRRRMPRQGRSTPMG